MKPAVDTQGSAHLPKTEIRHSYVRLVWMTLTGMRPRSTNTDRHRRAVSYGLEDLLFNYTCFLRTGEMSVDRTRLTVQIMDQTTSSCHSDMVVDSQAQVRCYEQVPTQQVGRSFYYHSLLQITQYDSSVNWLLENASKPPHQNV